MRRTRPQPLRSAPRVSVVIPCYRYGHFLPGCVDSVLSQEGVDADVLIVDDASPDDSADVARKLAAGDPRVRVVVHEVNQGHIATYNEGLAAATGTYALLLSADDLLAPGSLANSTALLETNPDVGLVYGFTRSFADTPPVARTRPRSWSVWSGDEWLDLLCRRVSNPIYTPEAVMRTSVLHDIGGYDKGLPHAADMLMWLRAAARGSIGRVNGVDLAFYRFHGENMHLSRYPGAARDLTERSLAFDTLFTQDGHRLSDVPRLRARARAGMAREALVLVAQAYRQSGSTADREALRSLVSFAERTWPDSKATPLHRRCTVLARRAEAGKGPVVPPGVTAFRDRAVGHLRWRRWRATGIDAAVGSW